LVSLPVRLYNAVSSSNKVSFNQLHSKTHRRLKQQMVEPELGPVDRTDIVKGYEYEKERYVIIDDADLEKVRLETTRVVELMQFIDASELDPMYLDNPYYVAPDGPVAEDAFRVIREAMKAKHRIGIGRVVMNGREHIVAMRVQDKGFVLTTLRYAAEVRGADTYFEDIRNGEVNKAQLQLAEQLIEGMTSEFDPSHFNDRYQDALMEVIKAKIDGAEPVVAQEVEVGKVINLMDALKQSIAAAPKKPPAKSIAKEEKKTTKKRKLA
jgi:DNA end-binding protein Ku